MTEETERDDKGGREYKNSTNRFQMRDSQAHKKPRIMTGLQST